MWSDSRVVSQRLRTPWNGTSSCDLSPPSQRARLESSDTAELSEENPLVQSSSALAETPERVGRGAVAEVPDASPPPVAPVAASPQPAQPDEPDGADKAGGPDEPDGADKAGGPDEPDGADKAGGADKADGADGATAGCGPGADDSESPRGSPCPSDSAGCSPVARLRGSAARSDSESSGSGRPSAAAALSEEQRRVFEIAVREHRSVLLTGGAGTGKSHLLRAIVNALPRMSTIVTAMTGLAALNLGGVTLHSFAGCGMVDPLNDTALKVYNKLSVKARASWRRCRVLVIDEISMMEAWFFDVLEYIARKVRNNPSPFGGIQLILSGDFLQLPPVVQGHSPHRPLFCFEADCWCRVNAFICVLSQSFRQKNEVFFSMLNEVRSGVLSNSSIALLTSLSVRTRVLRLDDTIKDESGEASRLVDDRGLTKEERQKGYTILRPMRDQVKRVNDEKFAELTTPVFSFYVYHSSSSVKKTNRDLEDVKLRVGCRVILTKNIDVSGGLVNGSTGTIIKFVDTKKLKDFDGGTAKYDLRCIDHKEDDPSHHHLPVVQFDTFSGGTVEEKGSSFVLEPQRWTVRMGGEDVGYSVQIPLQLAYAITIHKSQGMSLPRVNVDFRSIFADGQAYVALSRCTNMEHLVIENFNIGCIAPNPRALAFYKALEHRQQVHNSRLFYDEKNTNGDGEDTQRTNPWGGRDVYSDSILDEDEGVAESELYETDGNGIIQNATKEIDIVRRDLTSLYNSWSSIRSRVISRTRSVHMVQNSLIVMDGTSLLALATLGDATHVYNTIFLENQNMMRVPRVVRDALRCGADLSASSAALSPSASRGAFRAKSAAATAEALLSRARADFVLDEQRDDETRPLAQPLPAWEDIRVLLDKATGGEQQDNGEYERVLEFSQYLHELYKPNVYQCTESLELAAIALSLDMQVCSFSYMRDETSRRKV